MLFQGLLMVKNGSKWGTVCDDRFTEANAQAACSTLGYMGGSFTTYDSGLQESKIPILMDDTFKTQIKPLA